MFTEIFFFLDLTNMIYSQNFETLSCSNFIIGPFLIYNIVKRNCCVILKFDAYNLLTNFCERHADHSDEEHVLRFDFYQQDENCE